MDSRLKALAAITAEELIRRHKAQGDAEAIEAVASDLSKAMHAPGYDSELGQEVVAILLNQALQLRSRLH